MRPLLAGLALLLAGCLAAPPPAAPPGPADPGGDDPAALAFGEAMLIDPVRAGGEPVIAVTHNGVLIVAAHPGFTHYHRTEGHVPLELVAPYAGQSFVWRSTDGGATWAAVGLSMAGGAGPRGVGQGISDPDLTVTASNRVVLTDLAALASASVSWSDDDGATWLMGNNVASGGAVDRQWLASAGDALFFTANYFTDHRILRSDDGGMTWQRLGDVPCRGDLVALEGGALYAACGPGVAASADGGATWERRDVPGWDGGPGGLLLNEPAVDGAGNVWVTWTDGEARLLLGGSPDGGASWPWLHDLTVHVARALDAGAELTMVWPWVSAGSAGRVAVTAYATPTAGESDGGDLSRPWSVVTVAVFDAASPAPRAAGHVLRAGHHLGPICQSGTACEVGSVQGDRTRDRRLGDFFETTIDREGFLHVVYADTATSPEDAVSHPGYVRQTGGPRFVVDGFVPLQG